MLKKKGFETKTIRKKLKGVMSKHALPTVKVITNKYHAIFIINFINLSSRKLVRNHGFNSSRDLKYEIEKFFGFNLSASHIRKLRRDLS